MTKVIMNLSGDTKNCYCMLILSFFFSLQAFGQTSQNNEDVIINTEVLNKMAVAIEEQTYPNIHSVLIHYKGDLVFEEYFSGKDQSWGTDLGVVKHTEYSLHDLRSLTKSIVSICIGLAIQKNYIDNVDEKVLSFFPEYEALYSGIHQTLSIRHLLTMTPGLEWNEDIPYSDPSNSERAMWTSEDPVRYVLNQPYKEIPGTSWNYNGGTTELLAAIIHKTTGLDIEVFAAKYLFKPLEIETYYWTKATAASIPVAASGLRMLPKDVLKIGVLLLNGGNYKGKLLLNREWIEESFNPHVKRDMESAYGYQFWIDPSPEGNDSNMLVTAVGNGDQRIYIDRLKQLVVVTTAGNYNIWNIEKGSFQLLTDFIYPALE